MTSINLLPWREELRRQKTVEFSALAGVVAVATVLVVAGALVHINHIADYHRTRNQYLKNEIDFLNTKLQQIKDLEETKANLLARMNIIQQLQASRPEVVHLFEELVKTIPDGVWLTTFKQTGRSITITGNADSNGRVSAYMRNIEASAWLKDPVLEVIQTEAKGRAAEFKLHIQQESLLNDGEEEEG